MQGQRSQSVPPTVQSCPFYGSWAHLVKARHARGRKRLSALGFQVAFSSASPKAPKTPFYGSRKPRDYDAELQALMDRAKKLKSQKTVQLGELVQVTGADSLPVEALAGALLAAVEQSKKSPEAVQRWVERGQALFQQGGKRGSKAGAAEPASGVAGDNGKATAAGGAA